MIPTYKYDQQFGEPYEVNGRGWAYLVILTCDCLTEDLKKLIGTDFHGQTIMGVESFMTITQHEGGMFSLLIDEKLEES